MFFDLLQNHYDTVTDDRQLQLFPFCEFCDAFLTEEMPHKGHDGKFYCSPECENELIEENLAWTA